MSNEFEKYPVLTEYIREYASFGHFSNWSSFLAELNQALAQGNPQPPASAEEEAARLYPYDYENYDAEDHERVKAIRDAMRSAHITCARMYTGEIERLKAENSKMRQALEEIREIRMIDYSVYMKVQDIIRKTIK